MHRGLIRATLHMVNREFTALANDFEALGLLPPGSDKQKVRNEMTPYPTQVARFQYVGR